MDFRKAFDSVSRERLVDILAAYGVPQEIIKAITAAYTNTTAQVVIEDGNTEFFSIEAGVLQGDTLAPYSFIIVIDYVMRTSTKNRGSLGLIRTQRLIRRFPATYITGTDFADDIALLSDSIEDAQTLLFLLIKTAKEVGLSINEDKTEYMSYNILNPRSDTILANEKPLKKVDDLKYLGSWVDNSEEDMKTRKAQAGVAIRKLENIWKSDLTRKLKINLLGSTVESILLYGAETWTMTKTMKSEIDGTYTRLLRRALDIGWRQHVTNVDLYGDLNSNEDYI